MGMTMNIEDKYDDITRIAYENLSNHIILRAIDDYVTHAKGLWEAKHRFSTVNHSLLYHRTEMLRIKKFFFSEWFRTLSNIDPAFVFNYARVTAKKAVKELRAKAKEKKRKEEAKNDYREAEERHQEEKYHDTVGN